MRKKKTIKKCLNNVILATDVAVPAARARVAYILTLSGRSKRQLFRLFRMLYRPHHVFYIHVDAVSFYFLSFRFFFAHVQNFFFCECLGCCKFTIDAHHSPTLVKGNCLLSLLVRLVSTRLYRNEVIQRCYTGIPVSLHQQ